jgi:hypothetical protein
MDFEISVEGLRTDVESQAVRASLARTRYSRQAKNKTNTMKTLKLLALGSALLGVTQITQGSVLLGFNSFTEDATESPIWPTKPNPGGRVPSLATGLPRRRIDRRLLRQGQ